MSGCYAAREKVADKFGGNIEDHINLVINDGDQVDEERLINMNMHLALGILQAIFLL
jgi:hypothetical protein